MLLNCGVGEDSWESLGLKPVNPKGNQFWIFIGRTDAEAEIPILGPSHVESCLIGEDPDAGRDWEQEEKEITEDEMAGWHHWLDGHEFEWTLGVGDGQGGLECCSSWGRKESDTTERLNWTERNAVGFYLSFKNVLPCNMVSSQWFVIWYWELQRTSVYSISEMSRKLSSQTGI